MPAIRLAILAAALSLSPLAAEARDGRHHGDGYHRHGGHYGGHHGGSYRRHEGRHGGAYHRHDGHHGGGYHRHGGHYGGGYRRGWNGHGHDGWARRPAPAPAWGWRPAAMGLGLGFAAPAFGVAIVPPVYGAPAYGDALPEPYGYGAPSYGLAPPDHMPPYDQGHAPPPVDEQGHGDVPPVEPYAATSIATGGSKW